SVPDENRLDRTRLLRLLEGENVGQKHDCLDVAASPTLVRQENGASSGPRRRRLALPRKGKDGGLRPRGRKPVGSRRGASRTLRVDDGVAPGEVVGGEQPRGDVGVKARIDRNPESRESFAHPRKVLLQMEGPSAIESRHLVDRVREQKPAVLRRDPRLLDG